MVEQVNEGILGGDRAVKISENAYLHLFLPGKPGAPGQALAPPLARR
jgi:hypothetical protein